MLFHLGFGARFCALWATFCGVLLHRASSWVSGSLFACCVPMVSRRWGVASSWVRLEALPHTLLALSPCCASASSLVSCFFAGFGLAFVRYRPCPLPCISSGFSSNVACGASLTLWADALCSCPFVLVAAILWPSGLAPSVPIRLCLLRLFSGPLGWRALLLSVFACCACSGPLGWRSLLLSVCACCAFSLAL